MDSRKGVALLLCFIALICFLLWISVKMGGNMSLIWIQSPELDPLSLVGIRKDNSARSKANQSRAVRSLLESSDSRVKGVVDLKEDLDSINASIALLKGIYEDKRVNYDRTKGHNVNIHELGSEAANKKCSDAPSVARRFDCYPENGVSEAGCLARGCCWAPTRARQKPIYAAEAGAPQAPVDVPYCYYPSDFPGYTVSSQQKTERGFLATLERHVPSYYPKDVMILKMDVQFETSTRLHIKMYDPSRVRYEVPVQVKQTEGKAKNVLYSVTLSNTGDPYRLTVERKGSSSNSIPLFDSGGAAPLIYTDQFLQLSSFLPSPYIYGLGQHRDNLLHSVNWTRFTMWNRDLPPVENANLYGTHPFYLSMENSGASHGFFLLNSNAMDVILQPAPAVTWRTIGGILDFYFFLGPTPADVVQQYTDLIGQSFMPPYWSLGLHICRFGYKNVTDIMKVVDRVRKYGIPQDTQWTDIDYAIGTRDFTTDIERFGNQSAMVDLLHSRGMHYVILIDPGISSDQPAGTYPPYDLGIKYDLFVKNDSGQLAVGRNWPGNIVWPDFSHPMAQTYWTTLIRDFHDKVKIDGLWIDMDEVSNFVDGSVTGCPENTWENPPYTPAVVGGRLYCKTMCVSARQHSGRSYDVHNIYNLGEAEATYRALRAVRGRRPFVLSRSTYPSMSKHGSNWSGDNSATYYDLYKSISEMLSMSISGVTMNGADICGFHRNTTPQLCQRWYQLGAFYPLSRNHNDNQIHKDQDPGAFGEAVAASTRKVYLTRYSLLPYLYTLMYWSHVSGATAARPLFFEFPQDRLTYTIDRQFLWGPALLISPVLDKDVTSVTAYFPTGVWYDFYTGRPVGKTGTFVALSAPLDVINLHVRGGFIVPMQEPGLTTTVSRKNKFSLLVALDSKGSASGDLFWDDGDSIDTHKSGMCNRLLFNATKGVLTGTVLQAGYQTNMLLGNVTVLGVESRPSHVLVDGTDQQFTYHSSSKVLRVPDLDPGIQLLKDFKLTWT